MNLSHLRFVLAVAELKSFSKAASKCHVTQSTLSSGVAEIEKMLGERLFDRTTRIVTLSSFGEAMLPHINSLLSAESNLIFAARTYLNPQKTLIKIGVSPLLNAGFTSRLTQGFHDANPNYDFVLYEENLENLRTLLLANELDFIFIPDTGNHKKLKSVALYDEPLVLITQTTSILNSNSASATSLKNQKLVMVPDTCGLSQVTREVFKKAKVPFHEYEGKAFSYSALTDWAQNGIGSAILPKSKVGAHTGALPLLDSNDVIESIRYLALYSPSNYSRFKPFIQYIRKNALRLTKELALQQSN